jgi:glycerol-3-phosphate dehydrogenase
VLPRVVDIMGQELDWDRTRKRQEIEKAVEFLGTMGLALGAASVLPEPSPRGFLERMESAIWRTTGGATAGAKAPAAYSRAQFEPGEVDALRDAFLKKAKTVIAGAGKEMRVSRMELSDLLKDLQWYEEIPLKDYDYVLDEAGFRGRVDVDFHEFVEVSSTAANVLLSLTNCWIDLRKSERSIPRSGEEIIQTGENENSG